MRISIAGICCEFLGLDEVSLGGAARERYSAFVSEDRPDITVVVNLRSTEHPPGVPTADPSVRIAARDDGKLEMRRLDNPFEAQLDLAAGQATVALDANEHCLDSFVRILYSVLLAAVGGFLLHSVAVVSAGKATVLAGASGAGKTTLGRMGFATVLGDELVAVRPMGESYFVSGTPFWGDFVAGRVNEGYEIGSLFLLRKGSQDEVTNCDLAEAMSEVLGCVFFFGPSYLVPRILDSVGELVEGWFGGELHFKPTSDVVAFIEGRAGRDVA